MAVQVGKLLWMISKRLMRDKLILRKIKKVEEPEWGMPTPAYTDYEILGLVAFITPDELAFLPPGIVEIGDLQAWLLPKYIIGGTEVVPELMDQIIYMGDPFEIRSYQDITAGGFVALKMVFARKLQPVS